MNKFPKISIITVVYNNVQSIEKTIKNVLKQTYSNKEYIIIDGGSKDGTLDIIEKYRDLVIYVSEPDKGIYDAMNKGLMKSSGEWVIFRNCGDYFFDEYSIEKVFMDYRDCGEDFIACGIRYFNDYGYRDKLPNILNVDYLKGMPFDHPSTFIRRKTHLNNMYDCDLRNSSDYKFFAMELKRGAKYVVNPLIISLFDNRDGVSSANYKLSIKENIIILKELQAPKRDIWILYKKYVILLFKNAIKSKIPFYNKFHRINLNRLGWIKCDINKIIEGI